MQHTGRELPRQELVAVGLLQSGGEQPGFDRAAPHEEGLHGAAGPGIGGQADVAGQAVAVPAALHRNHFGTLPAVNAVERRLKTAGAGGGEGGFAVPEEGDGHIGVGQSLQLDGGGDTPTLHGIGAHELHPGRGVVEQIPDDDGGAVGAPRLRFLDDLPRFQTQAYPGEGAGGLGQKIDAADGGDGRQCLPPEAHGADSGEVLRRAQLRGGVAEKGCPGILRLHTAAVVCDAQEGHAAVPDLHGNLGGTGVHGVFQQLLDHGGGTLHHFARGDEVGDMGGKLNDLGHKVVTSGQKWPQN